MALLIDTTARSEESPAADAHAEHPAPPADPVDEPEILGDVVVEELSIDGMCGVY
jgi:mycofactocin precursor